VSKAKNVRVASSSLAPDAAEEPDELELADDFFLEALDVEENAEHPLMPPQAATSTHIVAALTKCLREGQA
jgi:hypothetical protein